MHCNGAYHNHEVQRKQVEWWHEKITKDGYEGEYPQVKLFLRRNELNIDQVKTETIIRWAHNVKGLRKKVE